MQLLDVYTPFSEDTMVQILKSFTSLWHLTLFLGHGFHIEAALRPTQWDMLTALRIHLAKPSGLEAICAF
jgi:hypothetical protein